MAETMSMTTSTCPAVLLVAVSRDWLWPVSPSPALRRMRRESGIRGRGEPVNVTIKTWKLLTKPRCPLAATAVVQAITVLHHVVNPIFQG